MGDDMIEDLINIRSLKLKNGRTLEGQLKHEQKRLLSLIQKYMSKWYASYDRSECVLSMRGIMCGLMLTAKN